MTASLSGEGGHGAVPLAGVPVDPEQEQVRTDWPLYEVFLRGRRGQRYRQAS